MTKNGREYILFTTDVYFNEYFLAVEIDIIFEKKRQEALEKKIGRKFIRINTSDAERRYDIDYEVSKIQIFISKFKGKKIKKKKAK